MRLITLVIIIEQTRLFSSLLQEDLKYWDLSK
jgi:hypothetical protein